MSVVLTHLAPPYRRAAGGFLAKRVFAGIVHWARFSLTKPEKDMRIVCATDFSKNARHAADAAVSIAERFKTNLKLVHAVNIPSAHLLPEPMRETWSGEARLRLRKLAESISQRDPDVTTELLVGVPDEAIVDHAGNTRSDLVVMGALGERDADHWIIGSTAERVADASPTPILLVRDEKPFRNWAEAGEALKVLIAYDFDETSDLALAGFARWAQVGKMNVTVVHVDWPPEEQARLGIHDHISVTGNDAVVQAVLERDLRKKLQTHLDDAEISVRVEASFGTAVDTLLQLIHSSRPDLVVCGTHQRTGLARFWRGSVSLELARNSLTNVLLIPAPAAAETQVYPHTSVLAATDFSDAGDEAVLRAYSLLPTGGVVHLAHVTQPHTRRGLIGPNPESQVYGADEHILHLKELENRLRRLIPVDAERLGLKTQIEILEESDTAAGICQAAERHGVDAICIGASRGGLVRRLLESPVTGAVINRSSRPVFVVKPPAR